MWESTLDGKSLHFHLVGLNNRNFIMQDEETGTWWQQVTGKALLGPLKGKQLKPVPSDMITFGTWKQENALGRVLRPDARDEKWKEFADEFERDANASTPTPLEGPDDQLDRKEIITGVELNGIAKAYPLKTIQKQSPILDTVGGVNLVIVMADDMKSVRGFETNVDGRNLEFHAKVDAKPLRLIDQETGSEWDFSGRCISGPLAGRRLRKVNVLTEYWFDWENHHPSTTVYALRVG